ncbi:MAG: MBOAT family protein [Lachnospiraceae bacterium]|nr:MBOAT family protein [Lachnospiraceae bacterium]
MTYFKYFNFIIYNINLLFKGKLSLFDIALPLGISFLTFQQIAYIVDSYRDEVPSFTFLDYFTAATFFPKLGSGPIVNYNDVITKLNDKSRKIINYDNFSKGILAFAIGLSKKVVLADNFGKISDFGHGAFASINGVEALMTILAYTLQIYFDFSGYSDMVIGIGMMFNIEMPINFNSPYKAVDIIDFWKRWHITLTKFLTKYIYIPLGGSRRGKVRTYINIMIVFLVSGIWHGAGYTFIVWGALHGLFNMITRASKDYISKIPKIIRWFGTFVIVNICWVYFRADSVKTANTLMSRVVTGGIGGVSAELANSMAQIPFINILIRVLPMEAVLALFFAFSLVIVVFTKNTIERTKEFKPSWKNAVFSILLIIYSVLSLSGISSFLYTNF